MVQPSGPAWPQLIQCRVRRRAAAGRRRSATDRWWTRRRCPRSKARFISSYTRCGLIGTSSKWVLRCRVDLRSAQSFAHTSKSGSARPPCAARLDQQRVQCGARVGDHAVVRGEHPADLGRLDVDVHERAALGVDVQRAGVAVGPAVADAQHEVGLQHGRVAVPVRGLDAHHAGVQRVVIGDGAPAHQGRDHRHAQQLGQFHQPVGGVGVDDAATGHDHRALGRGSMSRSFAAWAGVAAGLPRAAARRCRCRTRSRSAARRSAGPAAPDPADPAHQPERLLEGAGDLRGSFTVTAHLVTGPAMEAMSTAWKSSLSSLATGA